MGSLDLAITLDDGAVTRQLAALAASGDDLTEPMGEISGYLLGQIQVRFKTETDPEGTPWIRSKRVLGLTSRKFGPNQQSGQTLTERGDLRRSMREDHGRDYAAAGPEASGGAAVYARVHQTGYDGPVLVPFHTRTVKSLFGRKVEPYTQFVSSYMRQMNLPARPYLGFTADDGEEVVAILRDHMGRVLGGAA